MRQRMAAVMALAVAATMTLPSTASADPKTAVGASAIAGGVGLMFAAFNYDTECDAGYTSHTVSYSANGMREHEKYCVSVTRYGSDVYDNPGHMTLARPALLYAGIASAAAGAIVLLLPGKVKAVAPSVAITPSGVQVQKTVTLGRK